MIPERRRYFSESDTYHMLGPDSPKQLETGAFRFAREHDLSREGVIAELHGMEQAIFRRSMPEAVPDVRIFQITVKGL